MKKADINAIMVVKPEKELEYTEDNKFNSETSDDNSKSPVEIDDNVLPYNDDNLNQIMRQYYGIHDFKRLPNVDYVDNHFGKSRYHTTKHQPTDKVKKKARKNNRRAKRNNR